MLPNAPTKSAIESKEEIVCMSSMFASIGGIDEWHQSMGDGDEVIVLMIPLLLLPSLALIAIKVIRSPCFPLLDMLDSIAAQED